MSYCKYFFVNRACKPGKYYQMTGRNMVCMEDSLHNLSAALRDLLAIDVKEMSNEERKVLMEIKIYMRDAEDFLRTMVKTSGQTVVSER